MNQYDPPNKAASEAAAAPHTGLPLAAQDNRAPWRKPECVRLATSDTEATTPVGALTDFVTSYFSAAATSVS